MTTLPPIVVALVNGDGSQKVVAEYPFGSWGLKSTMILVDRLAEQVSGRGQTPADVIKISVGDSDWPADMAVAEVCTLDSPNTFQVALIQELFDRFVPGFVETDDDRIAHLNDGDRETYAEITIGTEKQIKYARDLFLEDHIRERRMTHLFAAMDELEQANADQAIKKVAAYLLVLVPKCSVFWIEKADSVDIREMILARLTGEQRPYQSDAGIRLGKQVDEADRTANNGAAR